MKPKIAIIGASIVGSAATVLLSRLGLDVTTFERSKPRAMLDRGVGLAFPQALIAQLIEADLLDPMFKTLTIKTRRHYAYFKEEEAVKLILEQSSDIAVINWRQLYQQLAARLAEYPVEYEHQLKRIESAAEGKSRLVFSNGRVESFDFVIFADGNQSMGRDYLYPGLMPKSAGYVAWRGAITVKDKALLGPLLEETQLLYGYDRGIGFFYLIPSDDPNHYIVNALIYERIDAERSFGSGHHLSEAAIAHFKQMVSENFPPFARQLFNRIDKPFLQPIQDILIDAYCRDNLVLTGDASVLLQPVTGSGANKGLLDVLTLAEEIRSKGVCQRTFQSWSGARLMASKKLFHLGKGLSDFYVMDHPDWLTVSTEDLEQRWKEITSSVDWYIAESSEEKKASALGARC